MPLLLLHASIEGRLNGCVQVLLMGAIRAFVTTPAERDELGGVGVSVRRLRLRPAPASLLSLLLCIELGGFPARQVRGAVYRASASMLDPGRLGEPVSTGASIITLGWLFFVLV